MSTITNNTSIQLQYSLARDVGWAFAQEYYRYFHDNPETLYQFYGEQSRLIRGLEGEEVKICQGLQEIKKNIADMHLKDAKVNINNIDSLDSFGNKVIVQITGRYSNKGENYRKFVQTVILDTLDTRQNSYYVSSDIFRYLKDEIDDTNKSQSIDQEPTYIEDNSSSITEEKFNSEDSVSTMSTGTLAEETTQETVRDIKLTEEITSEIPATKASTSEPSLTKSTVNDIVNPIVDNKVLPDNDSIKSKDVITVDKGSSITIHTEDTEKVSTPISSAVTAVTSPTQSSKPASWSNVAASDSSKWAHHQLTETKGRVVAPQITRTQSQPSNRDPRDRNKEFSLYVKGVNPSMSQEVLTNVFKNFGPVKSLDVVPSKQCAFVEFSFYEAYHQALSQRQIQIPGVGNVTVEERRKNEEMRHRNRQSYDYQRYGQNPHNGMGSQRGRGGDRRNMGSRPPAKSPS
ncbi:hypothetical protein Glove_53g31 [Diversispora epigaea]|uniref:NTF2 domain-containing protein n=1 Tax=Diversispora epigaea TaxID=1348612 RepID=A0A397JCZ7_9GLOM|nr:hypothetical protein Glove_53g31 [Diversispora epigaea]